MLPCVCYTAATTQSQCCGMMLRDAAAVKRSTGPSPEQDKVRVRERSGSITHKWAFAALGSEFSLLPTLGRRSFHPGGAEHPTSMSTLWDTEPSENCSKHSLSCRHPGWTFHLERTGTQGQLRLSWKEQVTLNLVLPTGLNPSYR